MAIPASTASRNAASMPAAMAASSLKTCGWSPAAWQEVRVPASHSARRAARVAGLGADPQPARTRLAKSTATVAVFTGTSSHSRVNL